MRRMCSWRSIVVSLLVFACGCAGQVPEDSPDKRVELATRLARLAAEHGAFDRVLDKGADLAANATLPAVELERRHSLSDEEQARLRDTLRSVIAEFISEEEWRKIVGQIYAEEFSAAELHEILRFYDTPLGHRLIRQRQSLMQQVEAETEKLFNSRLAAFIARADEAVAEALPIEEDQQ